MRCGVVCLRGCVPALQCDPLQESGREGAVRASEGGGGWESRSERPQEVPKRLLGRARAAVGRSGGGLGPAMVCLAGPMQGSLGERPHLQSPSGTRQLLYLNLNGQAPFCVLVSNSVSMGATWFRQGQRSKQGMPRRQSS